MDKLSKLGGGLVASGEADELRVPAQAGYFSLVIPLSGQRSPTYRHNTICNRTTKLYAQEASAGSMSFSTRNKVPLKKSNLWY